MSCKQPWKADFATVARAAYNLIREDFLHNRGRNCYSFDNYELDWSKGATHDDDFSNGLP